ncbi:putative sugar O-methyltransferase [Candidatus Pacearchaeota archaeon]|jgi:putative sugar O-methyltransferase|nr:putative sugar O-methyltransferase [Candidatus Pacearchaeota archaeon]
MKEYMTDTWFNIMKYLEKNMDNIIDRFMADPKIASMMVSGRAPWGEYEFDYLFKNMPREMFLNKLKEDSCFGNPIFTEKGVQTNFSFIHHNFHLFRYFERMKKEIVNDNNRVIEWGGGFGGLCKIINRDKKNVTYIIIDFEEMNKIQQRYLSSWFEVNMFKDTKLIKEHCINLISVDMLKEIELKCDSFITTWALTESSPLCLEYVKSKNWFDCKNFLIAFSKNPYNPTSYLIEDAIKIIKKDFHIETIKQLSDTDFYLFN